MSVLTRFINPSLYERIEEYAEIEHGTLLRVAPNGEYICNLIRYLPDGQGGEQAHSILTWADNQQDGK